MNFAIEKADSPKKYEGLRDLWCRVFGDDPRYVDYIYDLFGDEIAGYVVCSESGRVVSALTCYKCGDLDGVPVYVSYAVCTDPEYRSLGLGGRLTDYVKTVVTTARGEQVQYSDAPDAEGLGGISLVSPAEESLISFYRALGYDTDCFANEFTVSSGDEDEEEFIMGEDDDFDAFAPSTRLSYADDTEYNMYRNAFLNDVPHISLSRNMLRLIRGESLDGNGLIVINGGDAVCTVLESGHEGCLIAAELIVNPALSSVSGEIETEIASELASQYGFKKIRYRSPAASHDPYASVQSMAAGASEGQGFYFGFPIE